MNLADVSKYVFTMSSRACCTPESESRGAWSQAKRSKLVDPASVYYRLAVRRLNSLVEGWIVQEDPTYLRVDSKHSPEQLSRSVWECVCGGGGGGAGKSIPNLRAIAKIENSSTHTRAGADTLRLAMPLNRCGPLRNKNLGYFSFVKNPFRFRVGPPRHFDNFLF